MKKSILIVEDESIIALDLQNYLTSQNYIVLGIAKEAGKAIEMVRTLKPDFIF